MLPGAPPSALGGTDALDALNVSPGLLRRTSRTPQAYQSVCRVFHTLQDFMYQATVTFSGIMFEDQRCSSIAVGQIDGVASNITSSHGPPNVQYVYMSVCEWCCFRCSYKNNQSEPYTSIYALLQMNLIGSRPWHCTGMNDGTFLALSDAPLWPWCWRGSAWLARRWRTVTLWSLTWWSWQTLWDGSYHWSRGDWDSCSGVVCIIHTDLFISIGLKLHA